MLLKLGNNKVNESKVKQAEGINKFPPIQYSITHYFTWVTHLGSIEEWFSMEDLALKTYCSHLGTIEE